jgi:hypothetical protein
MQQATTVKPPNSSAPSGAAAPHRPLRNRFVINLCGSTTPVSLTPPDHAGLKRFTFFVSRRREDGRERFRLHMGYFDSQEEAERLLDIVREIYPAAWAGLAPGQRLQAQAEAAAAAQTDAAPAPAPADANSPATATAGVTAAIATGPSPVAVNAAPEPALAALPSPSTAASPPPVTVQEAPLQDGTALLPALSLVPDAGRRIAQVTPAQVTPAKTAPARDDTDAAVRALSNVRAAIASLGDTSTRAPTLSPLPELKPVARPNAASVLEAREISDSAALKVLESPAASTSDSTVNQPRLPATEPSAATKAEKTAFAVQLLWSVQPIDILQIPQLAIFSAYTLYGAEGNRDGRRWYGVRLGFFTDAVSAKQVAHYVRSDFSTVSVVPVTVRERERAKLASTRPDATPVAAAAPPAAAAAAEPKPAANTAFEFIEDKQQPPQGRAAAAGATPAAGSLRGAPGKRAKVRAGRPINGRAKTKPMTLEETLEILGAGELKIDDGRRALINDSTPRQSSADASKEKPSRFGRLLERLSERLGS